MEQLFRERINSFDPIQLFELQSGKLMARYDTKYILSPEQVLSLLTSLKEINYKVFYINHLNLFTYQNLYFDTPSLQMYLCHHNGKKNRYKIRMREYLETNLRFLEIKHKNNKNLTLKTRVEIPEIDAGIIYNLKKFIYENSSFASANLRPVYRNQYQRFTIIHPQQKERLTFDFRLSFNHRNKNVQLNDVVIVEQKKAATDQVDGSKNIFKQFKNQEVRLSKYCIGVALLDLHPKKNRFKTLLRKLQNQYPFTPALYAGQNLSGNG